MLDKKLRNALLSQSCCGVPELCSFLESEIDLLYDCQDSLCNPQIKYLYVLLGLIEAAQIFSRNKIDISTKNGSTSSQEKFTSFSKSRSELERDSSGSTCNWAGSTSQQFFNRSSTDYGVGFSETNSHKTASKNENGYDKSCRHTTGHGFSMSRVETSHIGLHGTALGGDFGKDTSFDRRLSSTNGGTGPYIPFLGTKGGGETNITLVLEFPPKVVVDIQPPPGPFLSIERSPDGTITFKDRITNSNEVCSEVPIPDLPPGFPIPEFPTLQKTNEEAISSFFENEPDCPENISSFGEGYNNRYTLGLSWPTFSVSINWSEGANMRQYYHCSTSKMSHDAERRSKQKDSIAGRTDASEKDNQTRSNELTTIIHLVRKFGSSIRRGTGTTDAEDQSRSQGNGIAHSESSRDSKGNGYQQSRSETSTVKHSESHLRKQDTGNHNEISNKYGQISIHLGEIWKRTWERVKLLERQFIAKPVSGDMCCIERRNICPCPVRVSYHDYRNVTQLGTH